MGSSRCPLSKADDAIKKMANLKVFISSTCYDLQAIRAQMRSVLLSMGYEPVMSDQAEVIYDPRTHTHTSCLREVANCDAVVLIVGSRFGGTTIPKALELIDLDRLTDLGRADRFGEDKTKISITQAEALQAIHAGIPIFAFVDSGVMRDHLTYEKNKNKPIINQIEFSSIDKSDTAAYIFEFINFLRLRNENNSVFEFARFEDIENQLKKQWAGLFQRLLHEQRTRAFEGRRIDNLSSQIADLKAAVLGSISSGELKETAKGAIRFRLLIDVIYSLALEYKPNEAISILHLAISWDDLLKILGIVDMKIDNGRARISTMGSILLREDGTYYRVRQSVRMFVRLAREWEEFQKLGGDTKDAILNAVLDSREARPVPYVRHYNEPYVEDSPLPDEEAESDPDNSREYKTAARILLTSDKLIEESLKLYLTNGKAFVGLSFLVDVSDGKVEVTLLPKSSGPTRTFRYHYSLPDDGKLSSEIERLKALIESDLTKEINNKAAPLDNQ